MPRKSLMPGHPRIDERVAALTKGDSIVYHREHDSVLGTALCRALGAEYEVVTVRSAEAFRRLLDGADPGDVFVADGRPDDRAKDRRVIGAADLLAELLITRGESMDAPEWLRDRIQEDEAYFSFGDERPDEVLYLCGTLGWPSGFFAEYLHALNQVVHARKNDFVPVVDWQTYESNFAAGRGDFMNRNAFNYFYEDVSGVTVADALRARHVIVCHSRRPTVVSTRRIFLDDEFREMVRGRFADCFRRTSALQAVTDIVRESHLPEPRGKVLAVYARGMEFRRMAADSPHLRGHELQPSIEQVISQTREFLTRHDIDTVLFASEDRQYCESMVKEFGDLVMVLPVVQVDYDADVSIPYLVARYPKKGTAQNLTSLYRYVASLTVMSEADYFVSGINSGSVYVATRGDFEEMFTFDIGLAGKDLPR